MHPSTAVGQSPATLKWLWIAVGALGASVLALGGTLLAQNLHSDAPMAQPVQESTQRAEISKQKPPQTVLQQAHAAPDSRANQLAARPTRLPEHPPQPVAQARPAAPVCASCGHVESVQAIEQASVFDIRELAGRLLLSATEVNRALLKALQAARQLDG